MTGVDLIIVGCSLDGVRIALQAAGEGRDVVVCDEGPGMTSLWPGFFDVFGPTTPPPTSQPPTRFARGAEPRVLAQSLDPQRRLDRLAGVRPDHACAALDFDADRVREAFKAWIELLEIPGQFHSEPVLVPTLTGTLRYVDFTAEGMGWLSDGLTTLVGLESYPQWSPEWAAQQAEHATARAHRARWCESLAPPSLSSLAIAGAVERGDTTILDGLAAVADAPSLVPPVLGLSFETRRTVGAWFEERGLDVGEIAGGAESAFGLRLHTHLRDRLRREVEVDSAVVSLPKRESSGWIVETATGTYATRSIVAAFDGLAPPAWAEPWLEPARRWPNNSATSPWEPQHYERYVSEVG